MHLFQLRTLVPNYVEFLSTQWLLIPGLSSPGNQIVGESSGCDDQALNFDICGWEAYHPKRTRISPI